MSLAFLSLIENPAGGGHLQVQLTSGAKANWTFNQNGATIVRVVENDSSDPLLAEHRPTLTMSVRFNATGSQAYAVYALPASLDLSRYDEVTFWIYANSSASPISLAAGASYSYGFFLYDSSGNWRGLIHQPISWSGWDEVVLPMNFIPNDASPGWETNFSLARVSGIWFYFQPENSVDSNVHSVTFSSIEALTANRDLTGQTLQRVQLTDSARTNWLIRERNSTVVRVVGNASAIPSLAEPRPTLTMSGRFNGTGSEVYASYTFENPINLNGTDEIAFWIYADASAGVSPRAIAVDYSYSYGLFLYDASGNWKGLTHQPIFWSGWNEIVLPINFIPNDASPGWDTNFSLAHVSAIWFYFQPENSVDNNVHSITFSSIEGISVNQSVTSDWTGLILSASLILALFLSPIVVVRIDAPDDPTMASIHSFLARAFRPLNSRFGALVFLSGVIVKAALIMLTPLSADFISIVSNFAGLYSNGNVFGISFAEGGIWVPVANAFYRLWLLAPVDHPTLIETFVVGIAPWTGLPTYHFLSTSGSMLFLLVSKSLLLFFDLAIGFLIFGIVFKATKNESLGLISFALWTLSPLGTLTGVLFGGWDLVMTFFLLLSLYLVQSVRISTSAVAYGISIGTKLFPLILLPLMLLSIRQRVRSQGQASDGRTYLRLSLIFILTTAVTLFVQYLPSLVLAPASNPLRDVGQSQEFYFFYGPIFDVYGIAVGLTPVLYILLLFVLFSGERGESLAPAELVAAGILTLFAFSRLHPQFIIWLLPFLLISTSLRKRNSLFVLFVALTFVFDLYYYGFYFASWGNSFFFYPATTPSLQYWSNVLANFPHHKIAYDLDLNALMGSLFTGFCLGYLYLLFKRPS